MKPGDHVKPTVRLVSRLGAGGMGRVWLAGSAGALPARCCAVSPLRRREVGRLTDAWAQLLRRIHGVDAPVTCEPLCATTPIKLVGLDFGTTTSSALIVEARYGSDPLSGRSEIRELGEPYRSDIVFTPFTGDRIDEARVSALLDGWLEAASACPSEIAGGGAIITGLCARRSNAVDLARLIRARIGDAVIATADDPCLESFLAFMGSAAALSRARPAEPILNLDIGGGTTNLALGRGGEVLHAGCLFVGARHVEVEPGSYRVKALSEQAQRLFAALGIAARPGSSLAAEAASPSPSPGPASRP